MSTSPLPYIPLDADNNILNRETRVLRYDVQWGRPYGALDYAQIVISSNPLGFWRMDTDDATVINYGFSGSAFNGVYHASDTPTGVPSAVGLCDGAAQFNGSTQFMDCGQLMFSADASYFDLSITAWINPTRAIGSRSGKSEILFTKPGVFQIILTDANILAFQVWTGAWVSTVVSPAAIQTDKWTFFGLSTKNGAQFLHIDSDTSAVNTSATRPNDDTVHLTVGALVSGGAAVTNGSYLPFQGGIDEVAVYRCALSSTAVQAQFRQGLSGAYFEPLQSLETSPVTFQTIPGITFKNFIKSLNPLYYWRFNENAGVTSAVNDGLNAITSTYIGADATTARMTPGATVDTTDNPSCRKFSGRTAAGTGIVRNEMVTSAALNLGAAGSRTAFTFSGWFKRTFESGSWDDVCGIYNMRAGNHGFVIQVKAPQALNAGQISMVMSVGSKDYNLPCPDGTLIKDATGAGRDTWYHVAYTVSVTGRIRCFINGQAIAQELQTVDNKGLLIPATDLANAYFKIGCLQGGNQAAGFQLDEVHIHNIELTSQQINAVYMNGRYGSTYGSKIVSSGSDGQTEPTYSISCNELSELVNEEDISEFVAGWSLDFDDKQFVHSGQLQCYEDWGKNNIDTLLVPNTYVKIQDRHSNGIETEDTGWVDVGHFLVEGPGMHSETGEGEHVVNVTLRGLLKIINLDIVPTQNMEPNRLFVSRRPLTLVGSPSVYYNFQAPRQEDPTQYYQNWTEEPSVRFWVTKLLKVSTAVGDAKNANDLYRIKGAEGSVTVVGGAGAIHIDKEFYEAAVKDVGLGQPDTTGGVLAEFYRFATPDDIDVQEILGIGYDGQYYLRVRDTNMEHRDKTLLLTSGSAIGKMIRVVDESLAFQDGGGNLGNYQSGIARGLLKTWSSLVRGGSTVAWTNPSDAKHKDALPAYAQDVIAPIGNYISHYLKGVDPELDSVIPDGANITFIKITVTRKANNDPLPFSVTSTSYAGQVVKDKEIFLLKGGTPQATNKADTGTNWPFTAFADVAYGGTVGDTWGGGAMTKADVNSTFGFLFCVDINFTTIEPAFLAACIDQVYVEIGWELFTPDVYGSSTGTGGTGGGTGGSDGTGGGSGGTDTITGHVDSKFQQSMSEAYGTSGKNWHDVKNVLLADGNYSYADLRPDVSPGYATIQTISSLKMRAMRPMDDAIAGIPLDASLLGIEIRIKHSGNTYKSPQTGGFAYNWIEDHQVQLVVGGSLIPPYDGSNDSTGAVGVNKAKIGYANSWGGPSDGALHGVAPYLPAFTTVTYGGPTDMWGLDTDPLTSLWCRNPFVMLLTGPFGETWNYFGVQISARAQVQNAHYAPYMEAAIEYVEMTIYYGTPAGSGSSGGGSTGGDGASGSYLSTGFKKLYIRGPYGHLISPSYEGIAVGDFAQIGDDNSVEMAMLKTLLYNRFQIKDPEKPFYMAITPPQVPDGTTLPPFKIKLTDRKVWGDVAADIMSTAPPNYMLATFPNGVTGTINVVQKVVGQADFIAPSALDLAQDGTDYAVYTRVVAEGEGGDSINIATHIDYAGQAAVRAYHLTNYYDPNNTGSDEGATLTQTNANAIIKRIFDNSVKTPGPTNIAGNTADLNFGLVYQFSSNAVRRWTMEDADLFCLDIGKDVTTDTAFEIDAFQMVFVDTYRSDKGGRKIPQSLRVFCMTEDDYLAEFGKYPPDLPDQSDADSKAMYMSPGNLNDVNSTYMPPPNARSWQLLIDEFNCQDGQFSIENANFIQNQPTKFRFMKVQLGQTHFAYDFGTNGTGTYDGGNSTAVARVNMADIKLWTSRRIVAVAELGSAPGLDTGFHKQLAQQLQRRTFYADKNLYLDTFAKAQKFANDELLERFREFRPRAVTMIAPQAFIGHTMQFFDPVIGADNTYIIRALTKHHDGTVSAQITDFDPLGNSQ